GVQQAVDHRRCAIAWNEALAEVAREIVVGRLRTMRAEATDRLCELLLHPEARELRHDPCDLFGRHAVVAPATPVQRDAQCAQRGLRLLVQAYRWRRIERDGVTDQLGPALIDAETTNELPCSVGAFHLEPEWTGLRVRQAEVMQQRGDGQDFGVVRLGTLLRKERREEP